MLEIYLAPPLFLDNQNNRLQAVLPIHIRCTNPGTNSHTVLASSREILRVVVLQKNGGNYGNHECQNALLISQSMNCWHFAKS